MPNYVWRINISFNKNVIILMTFCPIYNLWWLHHLDIFYFKGAEKYQKDL